MADTNPIIPITGILTPALMTGYIAESKYIKGGYVVVKDIKERDDLLNTNLYESREAIVEGSLVYVVEENKSYRFISGAWQEDTDVEVSNLKVEVEEIKNSLKGKADEADAKFEEDAPLTMFEVGNLQKGSPVAGMSVKDILKKILYGTFYPTFTAPFIKAILSKTYQGIVGQRLEVSGLIAYDPGAITLDGKRQNNRAGKALYYKVGENLQKDVSEDPSNNYSFTYTFSSLKEGENKATVILHYAEGPQPLDSDGNDSGSPLAEGDLTAEIVVTGVALTYTDPKLEVTIDPKTGTAGKELAVSGRITYTPGTASLNGKVQGNSTGDITKCTVGGQKVTIKAGENALDYNYTFSSLVEGNNNLDIIVEYAEGPEALYRKESGSLTKTLTVVGEVEEKLYIGISTGSGDPKFEEIEPVEIKETDAEDTTKQGLITDANNNVVGYQLNLPETYSGTIEILLPREYKQLKAWNPLSSSWDTVAVDSFVKGDSVEYEGHTYIKYSYEVDPDDPINEPFQYRFMLN